MTAPAIPTACTATTIPSSLGRAVADVFDALVSERPYKRAWPIAEGIDFLKSQRGKHFDRSAWMLS
jgi:putative two-component system response regulator